MVQQLQIVVLKQNIDSMNKVLYAMDLMDDTVKNDGWQKKWKTKCDTHLEFILIRAQRMSFSK